MKKLAKNNNPTTNSLAIYEPKTNQTQNPQPIENNAISEEIATVAIKNIVLKDEETLSDVEDSEIDQFFLSKEEAAMKSIIWHNMHKNWVKEQAEKKDLSVEKKNVKKRKKKEEESFD